MNLAELVVPVMAAYRDKHNYYALRVQTIPSTWEFHKIKTIVAVLEAGADLVFCLDLDTLITNHNVKVEDFIDDKHDFYITQDINEVNAGSIIVKNSDWSRTLLKVILEEAGRFENEQNAIKPFANYDKVKILDHPSINSYPYDEYAPSYGLIPGRIPLLGIKGKPTHEQGNWEPGDFVAHLPGLPMSRRIEIFNRMKDQIVL
jgi:hypothetical protein